MSPQFDTVESANGLCVHFFVMSDQLVLKFLVQALVTGKNKLKFSGINQRNSVVNLQGNNIIFEDFLKALAQRMAVCKDLQEHYCTITITELIST